MVVYSDKNANEGVVDFNINYARQHFKLAPEKEIAN